MKWFYVTLLLVVSPHLFCQQDSDRIAARVNDDMITYGDVYKKVKSIFDEIEKSSLERSQKNKLKEARFRIKLRDMVDSLLIQQEAKKYKVALPDKDTIKNKVQEELKEGGETRGIDEIALEDIYFSRELLRGLFQAKSAYSQENDRRAIIDTFVMPMEMRQYYKDNVGSYTEPRKIKTRIITLFYSTYGGREQALDTARTIVNELRKGADFVQMAITYSKDGYAKTGGDWPRIVKPVWDFFDRKEGQLDEQVKRIAFEMRKGEISDPILLAKNCQIVKLEDIKEEEKTKKIKTRIITLKYVDGEKEEAEKLAKKIVENLRAGEDFIEVAKKFSDDKYAKTGGDWPRTEQVVWDFFGKGELPQEIEDVAFTMQESEISEPIALEGSCQIVKVEAIQKEETKPFTEVQEDIRRRLQNERVIKALILITERLRRESYIWPENLFEDEGR